MHSPIICALDTPDPARAAQLADMVKPYVGAVKLGLEFFSRQGPKGVEVIAEKRVPLFIDLKFHDIPNTVAHAVRSIMPLKPLLLTLHAGGGTTMLKAAADAAAEEGAKLGHTTTLLAVTVLTSMSEADLRETGVPEAPMDQVLRLGELAVKAGVKGLVCSPLEVAALRKRLGKDVTLVVPGIRPAGSDTQDQQRVMGPKEAIEAGATWLVIGRPITGAPDPAKAAQDIIASLN